MGNILLTTGGWKGDPFLPAIKAVLPQLEAYAAACGADMAVVDWPLDPAGKRGIFAQRLLIPKAYAKYDVVVHMDFDILIPRNLSNIFACIPAEAGFAAIVDPRGSPAYEKAWGHAEWTRESHQEFFRRMGLVSDKTLLTVNGGVQAFRPRLIADLMESWYRDDRRFDSRYKQNNDETHMAYIAQSQGLFAPLDQRFNRQALYALHETDLGRTAYRTYRSLPNRIRRKLCKTVGLRSDHVGLGRLYTLFVEDLLRAGNLVHFSGKLPVPHVDPGLLSGSLS